MSKHLLIEKYVPAVRLEGGINTNLPITLNGSSATFTSAGSTFVLSGANANSFSVGPNGTTNPTFNIDDSTTNAATGLNIQSKAAGSGVALTTLSSGTNESWTLDAKGSGTITLNGTATGSVVVGHNLAVNGAVTKITSANSTAFTVGPNGNTNPSFNVDASTASAATGFNVKSAAAGGGLALSTISSGSNENLTLAALGTGTITFNPAVVATSGGAANDGVMFGSIGVGLFTGTGAPTFSAMNGSIYVNSAATTTTTRIYVNNSGAGTAGTTWTNLTTAA